MSRYPDFEKRKRILQVAFEAFGDLGYKRTTIKIIADRAEIAPGTIYTYFKDKDELFLSTINDIWEVLIKEADRLVADKATPYQNRLLLLYTFSEELFKKSHSLLLGMFSLSSRRKMLRNNLDKFCEHAWPLFREGREHGSNHLAKDDKYGAFQIKTIFSGAMFELSLVEGKDLDLAFDQIKAAFYQEFLQK